MDREVTVKVATISPDRPLKLWDARSLRLFDAATPKPLGAVTQAAINMVLGAEGRMPAWLLDGSLRLHEPRDGLLTALWSIDGEGTKAFMDAFYAEIAAVGAPAEALSGARQTFLRHPRFSDPHYGAPFVLTGG